MIGRLLRWARGTLARHELRNDQSTYLGFGSMDVNGAQDAGLHLIALPDSPLTAWEFAEILSWCRARCCRMFWDKVIWDDWRQRWEHNSIGGGDVLFIMTDDESVAAEARLTWT